MKSLKIAIIALFSVSVLAACESNEIAPSTNHFSGVVPETRDFDTPDTADNQGAKSATGIGSGQGSIQPAIDVRGVGISKEAVLTAE